MKKRLLLSLACILLLVFAVSCDAEMRGKLFDAMNKAGENFTELNNHKIVFAGDSITEAFPLYELFPNYPVINRGFSGDTSRALLSHIENTIIPLEPKKIFLQIGTNDIGTGISREETISNIASICEKIRKSLPNCEIVLISVYPINHTPEIEKTDVGARAIKGRTNETIILLNQEIEALAVDYGKYLNLYPLLTDDLGMLKKEYTPDGLHLRISGYLAIKDAIKELL